MKVTPPPICPSCEVNFRLKKCISIVFCQHGIIGYQIQLCRECSSNPDVENIRRNLTDWNWPEEKIEQAIKAIMTGEVTVTAEVTEIADGVFVLVEKIKEPLIPVEEILIPQEAVVAGEPVPA